MKIEFLKPVFDKKMIKRGEVLDYDVKTANLLISKGLAKEKPVRKSSSKKKNEGNNNK